ncbi:MAG: hypothetical protein K940chlam8_01041 [Chlamydiae bacterium]|nr:hypothetical protein [Chlamydiota bacterium]
MTTSSEGLNESVSEMFSPMFMGAGCACLYNGFAHSHRLAIVTSAILCVASAAFGFYSKNYSNDSKFNKAQKACFCVFGASGVFFGGGISSKKHIVLSLLVDFVALVTSCFLETKKRKTNEVS